MIWIKDENIKKFFYAILIISCCLNGFSEASPPRKPFVMPEEGGAQGRGFGGILKFIHSVGSKFINVLGGRTKQQYKPHPVPDLTKIAEECPRNEFYSSMNPNHRKAVNDLEDIMIKNITSTDDYLNFAAELRNRTEINLSVWYRALIEYAYNSPYLEGISKPTPIEIMPDLFINAGIWKKAKQQHQDVQQGRAFNQECIVWNETLGEINGAENRLWYFREDMFLNSHHLFFHVANPTMRPTQDRRGELFYYMHHSMIARYNAERLSNGLDILVPFQLIEGSSLTEGYYPNLENGFTSSSWSDRPPGTRLSSINRGSMTISIQTMLITDNRVRQAINFGYLVDANGRRAPLESWKGIELLGNVLQSSDLSINPVYYGYGGLHNEGHVVLAYSTDPNNRLRSAPGVLGDESTAIRDPLFYRWHGYIDKFFDNFQRKLTPYQLQGGEFPLVWDGVVVSEFEVREISAKRSARLTTYFKHKKVRLSRGLDFTSLGNNEGKIDICIKHMDHKPFSYSFVIEKKGFVSSSISTVRIYMAPSFLGPTENLIFRRSYFFVLDTFTTNLQVGRNVITRNSTDSVLTIPSDLSIDEIGSEGIDPRRAYCGCGWPHHLLIPKGKERSGMYFDIFVMVTNGNEDDVQNSPSAPQEFCESSYLLCGIPGRKYPDSRPMNYPFDRLPFRIISNSTGDPVSWSEPNLEQYSELIPNTAITRVIIKHIGELPNECCEKVR